MYIYSYIHIYIYIYKVTLFWAKGSQPRRYRFRDTDGDGKVTVRDEISSHSTGNGFQGAPAISDGILAIAPCNGLQVFLS